MGELTARENVSAQASQSAAHSGHLSPVVQVMCSLCKARWGGENAVFRGADLSIQGSREHKMTYGEFHFLRALSLTWNSIGYCAEG